MLVWATSRLKRLYPLRTGRTAPALGVYESEDRPDFAQLVAARSALASPDSGAQIHEVVDSSLRHRVAAEERKAGEAALSKGDIIQPPQGPKAKETRLSPPSQTTHRYPWLREKGRVLGATRTHGI